MQNSVGLIIMGYSLLIMGGFLIGMAPQTLRGLKMGKSKDLFKCSMCSNCCRFRIISVTEDEVKRLENAGHTGFTEFVGKQLSMKVVNGKCIFNDGQKCTVYELRPDTCRDFPFSKFFGMEYCRPEYFCPAQEELLKRLK